MTPISKWAGELHGAAVEQSATQQLSELQNYTLAEAYKIQHELIAHRTAAGHPIVGVKMGFTSRAKMEQMGVDDMIIGQLTRDMWLDQDHPLVLSQCIHPRAEPEIAFRLSCDVDKPLNAEEVHACVDGVAAAVEVIDSRYQNFKFSLEDVVADNCSSCAFALGPWCDVPLGLNGLDMVLKFDGQVVDQGSSDAILEDPFEALAAATRLAYQHGIALKKGMVVLAGASTAAHFIESSKAVVTQVDGLGVATFATL